MNDDGLEVFVLEKLDESDSSETPESESNATDESGVLAWINKIAPNGCTSAEVQEILKRLDESTPMDKVFSKARTRKIDNDIGEVYSPPRIAARANRHGLRPGFSKDLTTTDLDGEPWGFNLPRAKYKAIDEFNEPQPEILIMSPMCGPFGQLQGLNYSKMIPEDVEVNLRKGISHLKFCMLLCEFQSDKRRHFMMEHPSNATSWTLVTVKEIMELPNVMVIRFDFCQYNMKSSDNQGEGLVKKRGKVMINSTKLAKRLRKAQCAQDHRRVPLINYRAGPCQEYTDAFCDEVCQAVKEELFYK